MFVGINLVIQREGLLSWMLAGLASLVLLVTLFVEVMHTFAALRRTIALCNIFQFSEKSGI